MAQACPLTFKQIDGTIARISALFVSLGFLLFLATNEVTILYFLAIDFLIRIYANKRISLVYQASLALEHLFKMKIVMVDSGAKRVAAFFGLGFIVLSAVLFHLGAQNALYVVAAVFLSCTSLELFFSYCLGCKVYYIYKKIF